MNRKALPPLRETIKTYGLRAQKKLGQNFLLDSNITDKIARIAGDLTAVNIFEIGPGPGGLTRSLLSGSAARKVIAVEYDPRAVRALADLQKAFPDRLEIIHGDALETDLLSLAPRRRAIIANLPYNIATPLLIKWLKEIRSDPAAYEHMTLMFQKEVAERITASPGGKTYGRLSVLTQWLCAAEIVYELPPSAFTPPPKVSAAVVRFVPRAQPESAPPFEAVEAVTAAAFGQRRKMIRSSLKAWAPHIKALGLDPRKRAENLTVEEFVKIAKVM